MKGFIELHTEDGTIGAINIKYLKSFSDHIVIPNDGLSMTIRETYEEIKRLVEVAENE